MPLKDLTTNSYCGFLFVFFPFAVEAVRNNVEGDAQYMKGDGKEGSKKQPLPIFLKVCPIGIPFCLNISLFRS